MPYDLVIENGTIVDPVNGERAADVAVKDGRIAAIGRGLDGKRRIDASGCCVFPGFIDPHVHFRDFDWAHKATYATESRAAANGGVTTVCDMPNLPKPTTDEARVLEKLAKARADGVVDILVFGGVTKDNIDSLHKMAPHVCGYKIYMCDTTGSLYLPEEFLEPAMRRIAEIGKPVSVHCEDEVINRRLASNLGNMLFSLLNNDYMNRHHMRPSESEMAAIATALECAKRTCARVNICHVSTVGGLELIRQYNKENPEHRVMFEITPHHILACAYEDTVLFKVNPPLRPESERRSLRNSVADEKNDFMYATDHAPHTIAEKESPKPPSGISSIDRYPIAFKIFHHPGDSRVSSYNAAQWFGLGDRGRVAEGFLADLAVIKYDWLTPPDYGKSCSLYTKCGWTPYEKDLATTTVKCTIKRGKVIANGGRVIERPGEELA